MVSDVKKKLDAGLISSMAERSPRELIRLSEKRYRDQIAEVADRFAAQFPRQKIILLSGPTSSGKTTTSHNLDTELEKRGIHTFPLSLDDFFFDRDRAPLMENGKPDLETPELIDTGTLESCLEVLFREGKADFPIFDFKLGKRSDRVWTHEYDENTAIIIEGLHALNPLIAGRPIFSDALRLYISIKTEYYTGCQRLISSREMRLIRRIIRDNSFRGCAPEATIAMWDNVVRGEEKHIRPFRTGADVWIDSLHLYEPALYRPIAEKLLLPCLASGECAEEAKSLLEKLAHFAPMRPEGIPSDSLMREFLEGI